MKGATPHNREASETDTHGGLQIGYEISFTRYFYKPQPLRPLKEIWADILALERETKGLLRKIMGVESL